jgi:hypothetical protein
MKTKNFITALTALIILAASALVQGQTAGKSKPASLQVKDPICYTVQIRNAYVLNSSAKEWFVCIRDGAGRLVAPAQRFRPGVDYYNFYEKGPVRGTRTAQVVPDAEFPGAWIGITSRNGYFYPATCYLFVLMLQPGPEPAEINRD